MAPGTATLTGCVYKEKDVPGRAPNVAEKAGVLEDYILADVRPAAASGGTAGATGTSGTTAKAPMYKLELIADEKLQAVVGKRVEVTGRIDAEAGDAKAQPATPPTTSPTDKAIGHDKIDLPEFEVSSMKEVAGNCPAMPGASSTTVTCYVLRAGCSVRDVLRPTCCVHLPRALGTVRSMWHVGRFARSTEHA